MIVDFGSERPFAEASAYVGCIVATLREAQRIDQSEFVRVIRILKLDPDRLSAEIISASQSEAEFSSQFVYGYNAIHPRGPTAWMLISQNEKRQLVQIAERSVKLSDIAAIRQGIRSNEIFIFRVTRIDGAQLLQGINGLGEPCVIEREMARPVVIGPEITRFAIVEPESFIIYPYKSGVPLSEAELEIKAPQTYRYLNRYRDILSARRSIQGSKNWYELVRQRDENWLVSPKLLTRDLVPRPEFAIDTLGESLLVGGTAIIPSDSELLFVLCGFLNSSLVEQLLRNSAPSFRGGFLKLEPQHLENLPIPREFIEESSSFRDEVDSISQMLVLANAGSDEQRAGNLGKELNNSIDRWLLSLS